MRMMFTVAGIVALLMGLLWMGQGTGIIRWPAQSFMIDVSAWTLRGALTAVAGAILIWLGRKR